MVTLGDRVDDPGIPVVEVRRKMDEEDDWDPALGAEFSIGERDIASRNGLCGCVPVRGDRSVVWVQIVAHDDAVARAG